MKKHTFTSLCPNCGPARFEYIEGRNSDNDPMTCTLCNIEMTFKQAEEYWFPEPEEPSHNTGPLKKTA